MGVEGLSVSLALQWEADEEKTLLAALFHDLLKSEPRETQEQYARACRDVDLTQEDLEFPAMWHGIGASHVARTEYGIEDPEIHEAIAWHTTGNKNIGAVAMAIYVADFLEPTRSFDGVEQYRREILPLPMKEAARRIAELKVLNVRNQNRPLHSRTLRMKTWLEEG